MERALAGRFRQEGWSRSKKANAQTKGGGDSGLIEILKWCMVSDCLFRANRYVSVRLGKRKIPYEASEMLNSN